MTVQLLGKDDSSFDDSEVSTGRWQAYIDSYVVVCTAPSHSLCCLIISLHIPRATQLRTCHRTGSNARSCASERISCYLSTKLTAYQRNISPTVSGNHPRVLARGGLEIKVCVRTYRFFYVPNTEEIMWRLSDREEEQKASRRLEAKNSIRKKWMESIGAALLPSASAS
jgi:paired amphipathic helix protein Sin3a